MLFIALLLFKMFSRVSGPTDPLLLYLIITYTVRMSAGKFCMAREEDHQQSNMIARNIFVLFELP